MYLLDNDVLFDGLLIIYDVFCDIHNEICCSKYPSMNFKCFQCCSMNHVL